MRSCKVLTISLIHIYMSLLPEYAAICGITEEEMATQMDEDLDILAGRMLSLIHI